LTFECQKIAKSLPFFQKTCQKLYFSPFYWQFLEKKKDFGKFFLHLNVNFPEVQVIATTRFNTASLKRKKQIDGSN